LAEKQLKRQSILTTRFWNLDLNWSVVKMCW